jgi:hypothetical protein
MGLGAPSSPPVWKAIVSTDYPYHHRHGIGEHATFA